MIGFLEFWLISVIISIVILKALSYTPNWDGPPPCVAWMVILPFFNIVMVIVGIIDSIINTTKYLAEIHIEIPTILVKLSEKISKFLGYKY